MASRNKSGFTPKELLFIQHFAGDQTAAAKKAGYRNPKNQGNRLMKRPQVRAEIDRKIAAATKESAKRSIRKINFGRNDIIAELGNIGGLGDPTKKAESESARSSALRTLAEIFELIPKGNNSKGIFPGWTDEELDEYRRTGILPARFGLSAEEHYDLPRDTTGCSTGAESSPVVRPDVGNVGGDAGTSPASTRARK